MSQSWSPTKSPFWHQPQVTQLIQSARDNSTCRGDLADLVYRPFFNRLDRWLTSSGLKKLNLDADEIFSDLWQRQVETMLSSVNFNDRGHFLGTVLKRSHQWAKRLAAQIRIEQSRTVHPDSAATGTDSEAIWGNCPKTVDPAAIADYLEQIARVTELLEKLPGDLQSILKMHFVEGLSFRQIAQTVDQPPSSVHHRVKRGLDTLKTMYA